MSDFNIAAQLFTVRDYLKTKEDIETSLKKISDIGFKTVQVSGMGEIDANDLKKILDDNGLTVCCTHVPYDRLKDDLENVILEHKIIGCNVVGLGMMPPEHRTSKEGFIAFIDFANKVGARLREENMCFAYHNHSFEFTKFDGITVMDMIVDKTDPECVGFIPDVYWLQSAGLNPADYLDKLGNRVKCCHLKDMEVKDYTSRFSELGNGNIDFVPILKTLKKNGVNCIAIEQDDCPNNNPFDSLKISFNYLTNLIKTIQ